MEKNINMNKITETLGDAVKLAANLSDVSKKMPHNSDDSNTNSTTSNPNQTVQIQIADPTKEEQKKPVVIREKPQTHIHKEFPDNRALTDAECNLALKKAQMDNDLKIKVIEYRTYREEQDRADRLRKEDIERKEREERRIREEKKAKVRTIIGTVLAALGIGVVGYSIYADHKNGSAGKASIHITTTPVQGEGTIK